MHPTERTAVKGIRVGTAKHYSSPHPIDACVARLERLDWSPPHKPKLGPFRCRASNGRFDVWQDPSPEFVGSWPGTTLTHVELPEAAQPTQIVLSRYLRWWVAGGFGVVAALV